MITVDTIGQLRANVPIALQACEQWIGYTLETRDGKTTKVPRNPYTGGLARVNDAATWGTFDGALEGAENHGLDGIGFVFTENDDFVGIDFDQCIDDKGALTLTASEYIRLFDSYTETSPSGRGIHIICRGQLPQGRRRKGRIEMYDRNRFFTVTGDVHGRPRAIRAAQDIIERLHREISAPADAPPPVDAPPRPAGGSAPAGVSSPDDQTLIEKALTASNGQAFHALFVRGDTGQHGSDASAADLALCNLLAFWTDRDAPRMDRLFRQSALMRPKWDEIHFADGRTYGQATIAAAIAGTANGYDPQHRRNGARALEAPPIAVQADSPIAPPPDERPYYNLTDVGNAERLLARFGKDLLYVPRWEKWVRWDGVRWRLDDGEAGVSRAAVDVARAIYKENVYANDSDEAKAIWQWAKRSETSGRIRAMLDVARHYVTADHLLFDADPMLLNVINGTVDLRTGELRPHDRNDFLTRLATVEYRAGATSAMWRDFLWKIMQGNADLIGFLQRAAGYGITGSIAEECFFLLWGAGQNGKSSFLETLSAVLGDYRAQTPAETLLQRRENAIPNDIARLRGARFVTTIETDDGKRLAEGLVKTLTGGDKITARFMRSEWFDFDPTFKIFLATNHKPIIRGTDEAIWRRVHLIPFTYRIPDSEKDNTFKARLRAPDELAGILNWCIEGCLQWQRDGLKVPAEVSAATTEYRREMDVITAFIEQRCIESPAVRTAAATLYDAYTQWAEANNEYVLSATAFGRRMAERGMQKIRQATGNVYVGIGVLADATDERAPARERRSNSAPDF